MASENKDLKATPSAGAEAADKAAADKAAADKAAAAKGGAAEGAASVAEAVKRVADAAVAEVQNRPAGGVPGGDFVFSGSPGGRFRIDGQNLGTNGTVTVGGKQAKTTGWGATHIEGNLPSDVESGEVVVQIDSKTARRGHAQF